jgi:cytosine/adenosine deaminase-related metal-dependent hydrolase
VRRSYSPVHLLVELGVTVAHPLLIHCVKVDATDIAFISEWGCPVVHCPASNAKLGHGIAPVREMLDAGVVVGLGSDSMASNNAMHLLGEARLAALLQNIRAGLPDTVTPAEALALATLGGARALGLDDRIGSLDMGKDADLAAFGFDDPGTFPEGAGDVETALVYALGGGAGPARLVTVAGVERVRDGVVRDLDVTLVERVARTAAALVAWRKSGSVH